MLVFIRKKYITMRNYESGRALTSKSEQNLYIQTEEGFVKTFVNEM
jgi:hypothetical protein